MGGRRSWLILLLLFSAAKWSEVAAEKGFEKETTSSEQADGSVNKTAKIEGLLKEVSSLREKRYSYDGSKSWEKVVFDLLGEAEQLGSSAATEIKGDLYLLGEGIAQSFPKALKYFQKSADSGNPKAQLQLGYMYSSGFHKNGSIAKDEPLSLLHYYFAALGGVEEAQMVMGDRHLHGYGVPKSCNAAIKYYLKVAQEVVSLHTEKSIVKPIELVRLSNENARNHKLEETEDVIQYYQHSADAGNAEAQVALGQLNFYGARGVTQDTNAAAKYFRLAAAQGNAAAMSSLAQMHIQGLGVEGSNETAFKYFEEAAAKGDSSAQNGLGFMYLHGYGTKKDQKKAMKYFKKSAEQGNVDAQFNLGAMYFAGMGVDVDYGAALQYFTLAAHQGHIRSLFNLAQMHMNGLGTVQSCPIAVKLFKSVAERGQWAQVLSSAHKNYIRGDHGTAFIKYSRAADQGYEIAQSNVAWMLERQEGYPFQDLNSVALSQLLRAAKQGNVDAHRLIGDHYYYGMSQDGVPNYEEAARHYTLAGEQKNAHANFNLGFMHQYGIGLPFDLHLAKRFYDLALESSPEAYVPVQLALFGLHIHQYFLNVKEWWESNTGIASTGSSSKEDKDSDSGSNSEKLDTDSDDNLSWEDILLLVACGFLAVLIFFRSRRVT